MNLYAYAGLLVVIVVLFTWGLGGPMFFYLVACGLAFTLGLAAWGVGVQTMLYNCEDMRTVGIRGRRLILFCLGGIGSTIGTGLIVFSLSAAIYRMSGESVNWFSAVGIMSTWPGLRGPNP